MTTLEENYVVLPNTEEFRVKQEGNEENGNGKFGKNKKKRKKKSKNPDIGALLRDHSVERQDSIVSQEDNHINAEFRGEFREEVSLDSFSSVKDVLSIQGNEKAFKTPIQQFPSFDEINRYGGMKDEKEQGKYSETPNLPFWKEMQKGIDTQIIR